MTSFDSRWSVHTAVSLLRERNIDLDEYLPQLAHDRFYGVERIHGHYYSMFPVGTPLLAVPFVYVFDAAAEFLRARLPALEQRLGQEPEAEKGLPPVLIFHQKVEQVTASFIVALTSVLVYLMGRLTLRMELSLLLAFVFAYCTPAWSTASRALWQHGPSMLMLAAALYLLLAARERRPSLAWLAGFPLAFSYVIRPVNSLSVFLLSAYVFLEFRRQFIPYLLSALVVAVPFVAFNITVYGSMLPPYYLPGRIGLHGRFAEALAGNLVSPGRGLLVYSPVFLLVLAGIGLKIRNADFDLLDSFLLAIVLLHGLVIASFPHWWGGHSFGPRFFADMVPYLVYFLLPVFEDVQALKGARRLGLQVLLALLVTVSFAVHARGALSYSAYAWNTEPVNVDQNPQRLWDWSDPPFCRGLR